MPIDVGDKLDRDRLFKAIRTSEGVKDNFAAARAEFLRDHVGSWYSSSGSKYLTYVNAMNQTARILLTLVAHNNPRVQITTWDFSKWAFAKRYEVNVNRVAANIDLKTTLQIGVLDAFYLMGMFCVRRADSEEKDLGDNVWIDPGSLWVDRISFDDAILDFAAKDLREMRYFGHKYRASYDRVRDRDDFEREVRAKISPSSKFGYTAGSERASAIATGGAVDDDDQEPMVWLRNVYLPQTRELCIFSGDQEDLPPLKVEKQDQGPFGPYEFMGLGQVPDNIIPSSPAQNLKPLHDLMNRLFRKLSAQASRQKSVVGYPAGSEKDAERAKLAKDGEYVMFLDPKSLVPVNFPGADGNTNAFFMAAQEVFNDAAGNPRALAGLGREADTVGQERSVTAHAEGMVAGMRARVNECASNIFRKLGAMMWDDEALVVNSMMEAEHSGYWTDSSWRPGEREGIKDHYEFSVDPNSMPYRPPEAKVAEVMAYLQAVPVLLPLVQAGILDIHELTKFVSEQRNVPELQRMFKFMAAQQMGMMGGGDAHQATKAPVTTRNVVRSSGAGPTPGGMAAMAGQFLQGRFGPQQGATVGATR